MAQPLVVELDRLFGQPSWLDRVAVPVQRFIQNLFAIQGETGLKIRNFLNGVWLGHPLHAAISDLPVGAMTTALVLDYTSLATRNRRLGYLADIVTAIGFGGALAAATAGLADYSEIEGEQRRVGIAHAGLNGLATLAYLGSLLCRRTASRSGAIPLSTLGFALMFAAADLGGQMVYHLGTLVNRQAWTQGPTQFTPVLGSAALGEGQLRAVDAQGVSILLARVHGQVYALGNTCTHWGCALSNGQLANTSVICPCHGSTFDLRDGEVINGPATSPEISFDVRERNGQIEVRQRPY